MSEHRRVGACGLVIKQFCVSIDLEFLSFSLLITVLLYANTIVLHIVCEKQVNSPRREYPPLLTSTSENACFNTIHRFLCMREKPAKSQDVVCRDFRSFVWQLEIYYF